MQQLAQGDYTKAQIVHELQKSGRRVWFRYELLDRELNSKGWLDSVEDGKVENNNSAQVKRTGNFTFRNQSVNDVNFLIDLIRPWFMLGMDNGGGWASWPLGTFLMETSSDITNTRGTKRTVKGFDQLLILKEDNFTNRYAIPKGADIRSRVISIIESAGISTHSVSASGAVMPFDLEWQIGTSKLEVVNELLRAMNFTTLRFSAAGVAVSQPYIAPHVQGAEFEYVARVSAPDVEIKLDIARVPNQWVAYTSSSDGIALRSVFTNTSPNSITSTVNRGRTVSAAPIRATAADQAALDAITRRQAETDSQIFQETLFTTIKMPHHEDADVLKVILPHAGVNFLAQEKAWSMDLSTQGQMHHTVQRLVVL